MHSIPALPPVWQLLRIRLTPRPQNICGVYEGKDIFALGPMLSTDQRCIIAELNDHPHALQAQMTAPTSSPPPQQQAAPPVTAAAPPAPVQPAMSMPPPVSPGTAVQAAARLGQTAMPGGQRMEVPGGQQLAGGQRLESVGQRPTFSGQRLESLAGAHCHISPCCHRQSRLGRRIRGRHHIPAADCARHLQA